MKEQIPKINKLVDEALAEEALYVSGSGINNSDHESYAYILQEFDNTDREIRMFGLDLAGWWYEIKRSKLDTIETADDKREYLKVMNARAVSIACYAIELAAMVKKATVTLNNRTDEEE